MSNKSDSESSNPFAAPSLVQQTTAPSIVLLKNDYHIVERKLYCKNNMDFSDVCWLTGAPSPSYKARTFSRRLHSDSSIVGTVVMLGFVIPTLFLWLTGVRTTLYKLLHLASIAMILIQSFGGVRAIRFQLKLGRSKEATFAEKFSRRFLWMQIPIHVVFIMLAIIFTEYMMPFVLVTGTWFIGWLIADSRWNTRRFRATVTQGEGDYFVVSNLEPDFLNTLQQRLNERPA